MKRAALSFTVVTLFVGCSHTETAEASKARPPAAPAAAPEATPKVAVKAPSHASEPQGLYFEQNRDGKTYVLAYVTTVTLVRDGKPPANLHEKANFGPNGETVVFETDDAGLEKRLIGEYQKQHPKS